MGLIMGRKIVLTGTKLTNLSAPKLAEVDPIESVGSLMLVEPMHPAQQWAAGVPANGATLKNLLSAKAAALTGTSTGMDAVVATAGMTGARGLLERSSKGGLHAIYSNTDATNIANGSTTYFNIEAASDLRLYLMNNYGHNIFMSLWMNVTRLTPNGKNSNAQMVLANTSSSTSVYKVFAHGASIAGSADANGFRHTSYTTTGSPAGPRLTNIARTAFTGSAPTSQTGTYTRFFDIGNRGTINSYLNSKEAVPSAVFYRAYWEDLTVSGRTYAQVDAIDNALYTKQVLTPGGRYYGDTFTNPTTIP